MVEMAGHTLTDLLATYGYWAVFVCIAVESAGIPLPGETMLLAAAVYGGTTHRLALAVVVLAAAAGAILGDNVGYLMGREGGYRLLRRYGVYVRLDERRLKVGRYLFARHGGKVVFFGRFIAVLRMWAAFLAGTNRMPWRRFLAYNTAGGLMWAMLYGLAGYTLGDGVLRAGGPLGTIMMGVAALVGIALPLLLRRHEGRLAAEAERMWPGADSGAQGRSPGMRVAPPAADDSPTHPTALPVAPVADIVAAAQEVACAYAARTRELVLPPAGPPGR